MPAFFLELFSEEIPARMQARAADDLARLLGEALAALAPANVRTYFGARRIAYAATVAPGIAAARVEERGPRLAAPEQALAGFLRKHAATRDEVRQEGDFWLLDREKPGVDAATLAAGAVPGVLWRFSWPKSMRWGSDSAFTWVRPLRRIVCLLDGAVVPFALAQGGDDGHGLASGNLTEGHRFMSPGTFEVSSEAEWLEQLRARHVLADPVERRARIADGIAAEAAAHSLTVVDDPGLIDEISGLVEWPVPLIGRIGAEFMDLPPEVTQVSMRVNQRYLALRTTEGAAAPFFAFAANIAARDGGTAIVAGNERVLRARFSDARHFWDLDRRTKLADRLPALDAVTFHAKLGTQGARARAIEATARKIAPLVGADPEQAARAGLLAKADLTTGMVGEFPELQGVMGGYYAREHEDRAVAEAIREHYQPRGPSDPVPTAPVSVAVALADKLDQLIQFFRIGEIPTGSGDPFALRRAALGVLRILSENGINARLGDLLDCAAAGDQKPALLNFLLDRWRIQLRGGGMRHDIVGAAFPPGEDRLDDLTKAAKALTDLVAVGSPDNPYPGYKRGANILKIENAKDGPHAGPFDDGLFRDEAERTLARLVTTIGKALDVYLPERFYEEAIKSLARFQAPQDRFFEQVVVNDHDPAVRENRLRLLAAVRDTMNRVADFSRIEG